MYFFSQHAYKLCVECMIIESRTQGMCPNLGYVQCIPYNNRGSEFSLNVPGPRYPGVMQSVLLHATYIASIPIGIRCDILTVFVMLKKFNFEFSSFFLDFFFIEVKYFKFFFKSSLFLAFSVHRNFYFWNFPEYVSYTSFPLLWTIRPFFRFSCIGRGMQLKLI